MANKRTIMLKQSSRNAHQMALSWFFMKNANGPEQYVTAVCDPN